MLVGQAILPMSTYDVVWSMRSLVDCAAVLIKSSAKMADRNFLIILIFSKLMNSELIRQPEERVVSPFAFVVTCVHQHQVY